METTARVRRVDADRAYLDCESPVAGCGHCSVGGCALRRLSPGRPTLLEVPRRTADGGVLPDGARVLVEVGDGELLRAAGRAYLPPLAGIFAGTAVVSGYAPGDDARTMLGAALGLVLGWVIARTWLRRVPPAVTVRLREPAGHDR